PGVPAGRTGEARAAKLNWGKSRSRQGNEIVHMESNAFDSHAGQEYADRPNPSPRVARCALTPANVGRGSLAAVPQDIAVNTPGVSALKVATDVGSHCAAKGAPKPVHRT